MIESQQYPFPPVTFQIREVRGDALAFLDTGFDGYLCLPEGYLPQLGPPDFLSRWTLADGSVVEAPEFRGTVKITGLAQVIQARIDYLGSEIILGRGVLNHFAVTFDHGQRILATD